MLNLNKAKNYLKVDFDDDDIIIETYIIATEKFLKKLCEKNEFKEDKQELAEIYMLAMISELYNSRNLTVDKAEQRVRTIMQSILNQLRY
jgi:uncharacterized phage protein (predicted DNA packaging)